MKNKKRILKDFLLLLLCCFGIFSCKNKNSEVENPITSQEITTVLNDSEENNLLNPARVNAFYENRNHAPAWNISGTRSTFYEQLKKAEEEGLSFEEYHGAALQRFMENPEALSQEERATLGIFLTDAFFEYSNDLLYGKLDPKELYEIWGVERKQKDLAALLHDALTKMEIEEALEKVKPQHTVYKGLKKSLQEYKQLKKEKNTITKIPEGETIEPGDEDERVKLLAKRLKELNILDENYALETSIYDEKLQAAVKEFQTKRGLATDEILGNSTLQELNMNAEQRYNQILANLERWRWYPRDLGEHYILINIANYKLAVVKNADTIKTHNVVAGSKARQTPIFSDSVQYIVINPTWTLPPTIKSQDVIPSAASDPEYLENNNMIVTNSEGETLDPASIDWSSDKVRDYTFTQRPGPSNPLGQVKIIYPNKYFIYLHDTPAKAKFNLNSRAVSSGCVRVEGAIELSAYLLKNKEDWSLEKINKTIASGKTTKVEVNIPIRVHHFYWTAWRDNGETIFTNDVYGLDEKIYTALVE